MLPRQQRLLFLQLQLSGIGTLDFDSKCVARYLLGSRNPTL